MSEPCLLEFISRSALDAQMAEDVAAALRAAIDARDAATLVVSGGSTPKGFFQSLSGKALNWSKVTVTLADDRWVSPDHLDSNDRLVRQSLLQGPASAASFIPLVTTDSHPSAAEKVIAAALSRLGTLDVTILGMGSDGHFASLFPDSATLAAGLDLATERTVLAVDPPKAVHARMSMTLQRLLDARQLFLHIVGDEKRAVLDQAMMHKDSRNLPIAAVLESKSPEPQVYWAP